MWECLTTFTAARSALSCFWNVHDLEITPLFAPHCFMPRSRRHHRTAVVLLRQRQRPAILALGTRVVAPAEGNGTCRRSSRLVASRVRVATVRINCENQRRLVPICARPNEIPSGQRKLVLIQSSGVPFLGHARYVP